MVLSQGAGFWQLVSGVVVLIYGLFVKFLIHDLLHTVPTDGFVSYVPILMGLVIAAIGVMRGLGK